MLFVADIGNTNIVIGVFNGKGKLLSSWRIRTDEEKPADEYEVLIRNFFCFKEIDLKGISGAAVSSVVPTLTGTFEALMKSLFKVEPLILGPGVKTGMPIKTDNPREVGADRIANSVAAYELYGGPVIVADFGTATTFDVVSEKGEYLGGTISPGVYISMEALSRRAAKLPWVDFRKPDRVIGKNTISSMQSGIMCSVIGCINYTVAAIRKELGMPAQVVATGGLAHMVGRYTESIDYIDPDLTLKGLRIIYSRNK
ncbi:MAG TPA: type III pantothenate kinase [Peptococcaceae bacterium]|nr:MAG: Type III pantothenate kinase [Clostridia bacterium 41_269]HBT20655.1 type III pantothenate kinase [Peptococcaceae bacterium]